MFELSAEDLERRLDEADSAAKQDALRLSHTEVFTNVREHLHPATPQEGAK